MKILPIIIACLALYLTLQAGLAQTASDSDQAVINECMGDSNAPYKHWKGMCTSDGTNVAACYCSAAALIRCCMAAAPNNPNVGNWKKAYDQNVANAKSMGTTCFND